MSSSINNYRATVARNRESQRLRSQTPLQNQKSNSNPNRDSKSLMKSPGNTAQNSNVPPVQNIVTYNPNNRYFILGRGNNH